MRKRCFYPIIVLAAVAVLLVYVPTGDKTSALLVSPDEEKIEVVIEIADSEAERRKGLMYRESLEENHGMLFIFDQEEPQTFWMKNTLIPLDVIFFDAEKMYVSHETMEPCKIQSCPYYYSEGKAKYALEVPAGFVKEHGVSDGWKLNR